jgi:8-oxo-dGTP diphosphatase
MNSKSGEIAVNVAIAVLTVKQGRLSVVAERSVSPPGELHLPTVCVGADHLDDLGVSLLQGSAGIKHSHDALFLEQLKTYGPNTSGAGVRTISVGYVALVAEAIISPKNGRVFAVDDLRETGALADGDVVLLDDAVERVRSKFEYTTVATTLVTEPFTIPELRRVYESVWSVTLHPANFRRKVLATPAFVVADVNSGNQRRGPELFHRGEAALLHPAMLRPTGSDD